MPHVYIDGIQQTNLCSWCGVRDSASLIVHLVGKWTGQYLCLGCARRKARSIRKLVRLNTSKG